MRLQIHPGRVLMLVAVLWLACACGSSKKSRRYELTPDDLVKHRHVLLIPAGPALVRLDVGLAGRLAMKGLNKIVETDKNSDFANSLREAGLLPRETSANQGIQVLQGLGWQVSRGDEPIESPGKKFEKVKLPSGACEEAATASADSVLILYERLTIEPGATESLARSELWAHLFACPNGELLWRARDRRKLSLNKFILQAAKEVVTRKSKTLADLLGSLRKLVEEADQSLLTTGMSR